MSFISQQLYAQLYLVLVSGCTIKKGQQYFFSCYMHCNEYFGHFKCINVLNWCTVRAKRLYLWRTLCSHKECCALVKNRHIGFIDINSDDTAKKSHSQSIVNETGSLLKDGLGGMKTSLQTPTEDSLPRLTVAGGEQRREQGAPSLPTGREGTASTKSMALGGPGKGCCKAHGQSRESLSPRAFPSRPRAGCCSTFIYIGIILTATTC